MSNDSAYGGAGRLTGRGIGSIIYVALVVMLALSCWAGALWLAHFLFRLHH